MADSERKPVASQVMGVVYTDLVCYIIPGFFLLFACIIASEATLTVLQWAATLTGGAGLVVSLSLLALSYSLGLALSLMRWFGVTRAGNASFGRLVQGQVPRSVLKRVHLPASVLHEARRRIRSDLQSLGFIDTQTAEALQAQDPTEGARSEQRPDLELPQSPTDTDKLLFDSYWHVMRGDLRESSLNLFPYLDRWRDIESARENLLIAVQVAALIVVARGLNRPESNLLPIALGILAFLLAFAVRRWVLPQYSYSLMHPVLLRYLVGDLRGPSKSARTGT